MLLKRLAESFLSYFLCRLFLFLLFSFIFRFKTSHISCDFKICVWLNGAMVCLFSREIRVKSDFQPQLNSDLLWTSKFTRELSPVPFSPDHKTSWWLFYLTTVNNITSSDLFDLEIIWLTFVSINKKKAWAVETVSWCVLDVCIVNLQNLKK